MTVDESEFIETVRRHGDYESDAEARTAADAALHALGRRIARGEAADIAAHLPDELADAALPPRDGEPVSLTADEFVAYAADHADADVDRTYDYVEDTFAALAEHIPHEDIEGIVSQLPERYDPLFVEAGVNVPEGPPE